MLKLDAKPESVEIDLAKSAIVVVVQNAFASGHSKHCARTRSRTASRRSRGVAADGIQTGSQQQRRTLHAQLKSRGIRYRFFTGIATNVCVETTLRHAFVLDWTIPSSELI